jgi:hypothetical protein
MPIILAIWEAKIEKIAAQGHPQQKKFMRLYLTNSWVQWFTPAMMPCRGLR